MCLSCYTIDLLSLLVLVQPEGNASSFFVFDLLVSLKDSFSLTGVVSLVRTIFFEYPFSKPPYSMPALLLSHRGISPGLHSFLQL